MAEPFATVDDLRDRGVAVVTDPASIARAEAALRDASADLRAEIGWQVYPPAQVSLVEHSWGDSVELPGFPISAVSVTVGGTALPAESWTLDNSTVRLCRHASGVAVAYSVGYDTPPDDLVGWTCVLAADALSRDPQDGARPAYESLADWRVGYSDRQQAGELPIPERTLHRLKAAYGSPGAFVT